MDIFPLIFFRLFKSKSFLKRWCSFSINSLPVLIRMRKRLKLVCEPKFSCRMVRIGKSKENSKRKVSNIGRERGTKFGKRSENCSKIIFFCFSNRILRFEEGYYRSEICDWCILICQRQFGKMPETWEIWHFSSFCPYVSTHLSLKLGTLTPTKSIYLELARQWLSSNKILICYL